MKIVRLATFVSLVAVLLALMATPALADAEASASGTIIDNTITSATINPATGNATISGTVTCSIPAQVQVYAFVRQLRGMSDHFAEYFGGTWVSCGTTPTRYDVVVTPGYESDRLVPGPASYGTWAEHCTSTECSGYGAESDLRLRPTP